MSSTGTQTLRTYAQFLNSHKIKIQYVRIGRLKKLLTMNGPGAEGQLSSCRERIIFSLKYLLQHRK